MALMDLTSAASTHSVGDDMHLDSWFAGRQSHEEDEEKEEDLEEEEELHLFRQGPDGKDDFYDLRALKHQIIHLL